MLVGQVLTAHAMEEAVRRSRAHGLGAVALRNSNHFGTAMYFTLMAARGLRRLSRHQCEPGVSALGRPQEDGRHQSLIMGGAGRKPLADGARHRQYRCCGKIYLARQKGLPIPEGWAINAEGAPTTDPAEAIEGIILPMAQHKGYAIAVMMDMLSGILSGSAFGAGVHGPYRTEHRSGAGQFMIALNIAAFMPLSEFGERMERYVTELKSVPLAQGFEEIVYPGELEARSEARNRAEGILLPEDTRGFAKLADTFGLQPPFAD